MKNIIHSVLAILCPVLCYCQISIRGTIINDENQPVPGATIQVKGTKNITLSATSGEFTIYLTQSQIPNSKSQIPNSKSQPPNSQFPIPNSQSPHSLIVTAVGYDAKELSIKDATPLIITLTRRISELDEAVVIAYGKTTRRLNTGSVSRITAKDISTQLVTNPLAALEGRIPGLVVNQSGGLPGASVKLQLRGQNSLTQGSEPLFIIDGVPFAPGNQNVNRLSSVLTGGGAGLSPFAIINPADIESIEVLKDADATAIFGSRGANGVIMITTKRGVAGKTSWTAGVNTGISRITRKVTMLNTPEYLQMRREAFANDGVIPTTANAPDLLLWDTTRYTNFAKELVGNTAHTTNAQLSLAGGNAGTRFLLSGAYHKETTVFPGKMNDRNATVLSTLFHESATKKFTAALSLNYGTGTNTLAASGLAGFINLPPNAPALFTADGKLNWEENGAAFSNPLAYSLRKYTAATDNLISRLQLAYRLLPSLQFSTSFGYNAMNVEETLQTPIAAQNPATAPKGSSQYSINRFSSWIIEPQLNYNTTIGKAKLEGLLGASMQQNSNTGFSISGTGYTSDALLQSIDAAPNIAFRTNSKTEYRYQAFFGRISYNYNTKYIVNLSGRRDGSSRFGPGRQFAAFGAIGVAWLFSNETFVKKYLPVISFGKLRGSYGSTGNDQVGDYKYLDSWGVVPAYQGITGLYPSNLFNPSYGWEINRKKELALELGLLKNRLHLSAAWFDNRSSSQLVQYALPSQTGFNNITDNFPALIQNTGYELELSTTNIETAKCKWTTTGSITLPRNRLLAFPGLAASPYAATYVLGAPLSVIYKLRSTGVDPATGVFSFEDVDKNGAIQIPADYLQSGYLGPRFFGGLGNSIAWKNIEAQIFFVFRKQWGANYLNSIYSAGIIPGSMNNQPAYVLDRWQHPGDITTIQKFTAAASGAAYTATTRFRSSDGQYSDASFARLKTLSLAYTFPSALLRRWKTENLRFYINAQNLFTFTTYKGADPENQNLLALPPLKTLVGGIQLTF